MSPTELALPKAAAYVPNLFLRQRRKTREVMIGHVGVGGDNPIRVQSMTTTPTTDVDATVKQTLKLVEYGCEIVRITAPKLADARALGEIKKKLLAQGVKVPLVADIHFNPECAMEAANHVEKVRVNPGNYADAKAFKTKEYSDDQYSAELARIEERFTPLVLKCRDLGRAMRLGCNHGSLSDRIMNRYGDTPEGMVEAALEFVRICQKNNYHALVLSMKASNPKVMIAAYRLLAARMDEEQMDYPFHLGVTEAGYGEDGRIKSAIGIGSLLNDGIGDTIRVSLTEDPEYEVPVAFEIAKPYQPNKCLMSKVQSPKSDETQFVRSATPNDLGPWTLGLGLNFVDNFYHYARRPTKELQIGPFKMGGENIVRVFNDFSPWLMPPSSPAVSSSSSSPAVSLSSSSPAVSLSSSSPAGASGGSIDGKAIGLKLLDLLEDALKTGKELVPEIIEWKVSNRQELEALQACRRALGGETSRLAFLGRFTDFALLKEGLSSVHLALYIGPRDSAPEERSRQFKEFIGLAKAANIPILLESGPCHRGWLEPATNLLKGVAACEKEGYANLLLSFNLPTAEHLIANVRLAAARMRGTGQNYPIHLRLPGDADIEAQRINPSIAFGSLLCDGIGDSVQTGLGENPKADLELIYNVLQGAGVRITKTEFVSCPSCGRTLFDLQSTTERIKAKTGHLKGVKIAIMGCIVNGPGEMADADFGYVGGAPGKINLYVGKNCVEKGIDFDAADERLIGLIKSHNKWVDSK